MRQVGRYHIENELGRGGMGVVYRGHDPALGRQVAIKMIRLSEVAEPEERSDMERRLVREARSAGVLSHANVVTVYDLVQEEDCTSIVMEYVEGRTLAQILARGGAPENLSVLGLLYQAAAALDYAHSRGIVHRDVKPANLIVQPGGLVKIADFGVARVSTTQQLTKSGTVVGTPNYMSPEQVQGLPVDGRADQFSLAVIAYEILTGRKPFAADTVTAVLYKIVHVDPVPAQELNASLGWEAGTVLQKALSKEPEGRYTSCGEFVRALEVACSVAQGWAGATTVERTWPAAAGRRDRRRWAVWVGAAVAVVVLAAGGYIGVVLLRERAVPTGVPPAPTEQVVAPVEKPAERVAPPAEKPPEETPKPRAAQPVEVIPPKPAPTAKVTPAPPAPTAAAPKVTPPAPPEERRTEAAVPASYTGPSSGTLVWTGQLEESGQLTVDGRSASVGAVSSELPGVPVKIQLFPSSAQVLEGPGPANGWKRLVIGSGGRRQLRIIIRWEVAR